MKSVPDNIDPGYSCRPIFAPDIMRGIFSISRKLWCLLLQLMVLTIRLARQTVLPNRRRKGNLLNVLFLFFIGIIENVRQLEHKNFKMADLLQNRLLRKGLMLVGFLLFFLASFEQPAPPRTSHPEPTEVECSCQNSWQQYSCHRRIRHSFVPDQFFQAKDFPIRVGDSLALHFACPKLYLEIRCLLI